MFERKKTLQGKYICSRNEADLNRRNKSKLALSAAALLLFALPPFFLRLRATEVLSSRGITSVITAYLIVVFFTIIWQLTVLLLSFGRYALKKEKRAADAAKNGFEKHTWAAIEWQFYVTTLAALFYVGLTSFAFSWQSLIITLLAAASAVCTFFVKKISFDTYKDTLTFISLDDELAAPPEEKTEETALPDDVEDFYEK